MRLTIHTQGKIEDNIDNYITGYICWVEKNGEYSLHKGNGIPTKGQLPKIHNHNSPQGIEKSTNWIIKQHPELFI